MYLPDLEIYPSGEHRSKLTAKAVGWLDANHPYPKGNSTDIFVQNLWHRCKNPPIKHFGYHVCGLCGHDENNWGIRIDNGQEQFDVGNGDIIVFGQEDIYVAPNMIYHYVVNHNYQPPDSFVIATLNSPLPKTQEYSELLGKYFG